MRRLPSFSVSIKAWREVEEFVHVGRFRVLMLAAMGAVVGVSESAFLAILATVGIAIAGRNGADLSAVKLPGFSLTGLSIPQLLELGATLAIVTMLVQFFITVQLSRITAEVNTIMRRAIYKEFSHASWRTQRTEVESAFVNFIVFHVPRASSMVTSIISQLTSVATLAVFLVVATAMAPAIALVVIALGAVLWFGFLPVRRITRDAGEESKMMTRRLFRTIIDAISASREIKAYGVEDPIREQINTEIDELERPAFRTRVASGFVPVLYQRLVFLILLGGVALVYILDIKDVGAIGAALLIVLRAMQQAQGVQAADPVIAEARPWLAELKEGRDKYAAGRMHVGDAVLGPLEEIEIDNVTYSYGEPGQPLALDGVSFKAKRGQLIGVIGPSGSGKSTLSELLVRLDEPTTGTYRVNGRPASDYDRESWTRQVVLVPQMGHLITASVEDNIRFLREGVTQEAVRSAADKANLTVDVLEFEEGFDTKVGERGNRGLSGGQRQRLTIARALAVPPGLIVLDEPTSALDHKAEGVIVETIERLREHALVIVVAHRLSTLRHCDRVLVLRDGKTEAFCSPDELADQSTFFREAGTTIAP
ncbi:MAG TPA: ABC transporter ATP-binding protein [Acidimicrobiales bacterium]|nr:ABC transporter ATP-binding protein [Acidimicrobiales bacterium]